MNVSVDAMGAIKHFSDPRGLLSLARAIASEEVSVSNSVEQVTDIHVRSAAEELFGKTQVEEIPFNWSDQFPMF